ncbi:hypothetical protein, partial [Alistipes shahii]|uniref:hypothetical protein n=1 Tax=Alistipes shahii TaxID=328814 RepID=UPI001E2AEFA4
RLARAAGPPHAPSSRMENRNIGVVFIVSEQNSSQRYEKVGWDQNGIACGSVKPFGWQKGRCDSKGCGKAGWDQNGIAHGSVEPSPASGGVAAPKVRKTNRIS